MKLRLVAACLVAVLVGVIAYNVQDRPNSVETTEVAASAGPQPLPRHFREEIRIDQKKAEAAAAAKAEADRQAAVAADKARREAQARAARSKPRAVQAPAPQERVVTGDVWGRLAQCESGGNPRAVGGGGRYYGAFQFSLGTWRSVGGTGNPIDHDYGTQLAFAQKLQARSGWGQWPYCARKLGLLAAVTSPHMNDSSDPLFTILDERPPVVVNEGPGILDVLTYGWFAVILGWGMRTLAYKVDAKRSRV